MTIGSVFAVAVPSAQADPLDPYVDIDCLLREGLPVDCIVDGPCVEIECFTCPPEIFEACEVVGEFPAPKLITCSGGGSTLTGMETRAAGVHLANEPGSSHWVAVCDSSVAPWDLKSLNGHLRTPLHSIRVAASVATWTFGPFEMAHDVINVQVRCTPNPFDRSQGVITSTDHYARGLPIIHTEYGIVELEGTTCVTPC